MADTEGCKDGKEPLSPTTTSTTAIDSQYDVEAGSPNVPASTARYYVKVELHANSTTESSLSRLWPWSSKNHTEDEIPTVTHKRMQAAFKQKRLQP